MGETRKLEEQGGEEGGGRGGKKGQWRWGAREEDKKRERGEGVRE